MQVLLRKAQSTLEYAVVTICVVAALLAMQIYLKRGFSGRLRGIADDLGQQYEPKKVINSDITLLSNSDVTTDVKTEEIEKDGKKKNKTTTTVNITKEEESRYGAEKIGELGASLF